MYFGYYFCFIYIWKNVKCLKFKFSVLLLWNNFLVVYNIFLEVGRYEEMKDCGYIGKNLVNIVKVFLFFEWVNVVFIILYVFVD